MLDYALELHNLMLVYHADEHRFVLVRKATDSRHLRDAVLQPLNQRLRQFLRLIRDDLKFDRLLEALEHRVADTAGHEAVGHARPSEKNFKSKNDYLGRILTKMALDGQLTLVGRTWHITEKGENEISM